MVTDIHHLDGGQPPGNKPHEHADRKQENSDSDDLFSAVFIGPLQLIFYLLPRFNISFSISASTVPASDGTSTDTDG